MSTQPPPDHLLYQPQSRERQLSFRAVAAGCFLGIIMMLVNIYFGLQTGWNIGGALISAILGFALFQLFPSRRSYSILENNITQTAGSAASGAASAAGVIMVLPALKMLGHPLSLWQMYAWAIAVSFLGVFFAVPMRSRLILHEKLIFPSGTATAETIVAMHGKVNEANRKASILLAFAVIALSYAVLGYFFPILIKPKLVVSLGLSVLLSWGFSLFINPMLLGAGMIIGFRVSFSLLLGAVVSWGCLGPLITSWHWVLGPIMSYKTGVAGWLLWPGVALMTTEALMGLLLSLPSLFRSRSYNHSMESEQDYPLSLKSWLIGLGFFSLVCVVVMQVFFHVSIYLTLIALAVSWILCMVSGRAVGEIDINPMSAVGKITQLIYGGLAPGQMLTNLMSAGVTSAGSVAAGDMLQDWKTGYLLGASARAQFIAQCWGILIGVIFVVPAYKLFDMAYQIGTAELPAPSAYAWKAMSEILVFGLKGLPSHVMPFILMAALTGVVLSLLRLNSHCAPYTPSGLGLGVAFIVPAYYSITFFIGAAIIMIWSYLNPQQVKHYIYSVASGLIVGGGLAGVVNALLKLWGSIKA